MRSQILLWRRLRIQKRVNIRNYNWSIPIRQWPWRWPVWGHISLDILIVFGHCLSSSQLVRKQEVILVPSTESQPHAVKGKRGSRSHESLQRCTILIYQAWTPYSGEVSAVTPKLAPIIVSISRVESMTSTTFAGFTSR